MLTLPLAVEGILNIETSRLFAYRYLRILIASGRIVFPVSLEFILGLVGVRRYKTGTDGLFRLNVPPAIEAAGNIRVAFPIIDGYSWKWAERTSAVRDGHAKLAAALSENIVRRKALLYPVDHRLK